MQHMDLRENCTQILNYLFLSKSKRCGESIFKHIFRMLRFVIFFENPWISQRYIANFALKHHSAYLLCQQEVSRDCDVVYKEKSQ